MSHRYWDLDAEGYSFAEYVASRGAVSVLLDHPGTGSSDVPDDPWLLTPTNVAAIEAVVVDRALALLADGQVAGISVTPESPRIGIGHSTGSGILIHQQAAYRTFAAIAPLGWTGRGLPEYLTAEELAIASSEISDAELITFARGRAPRPLLQHGRGTSDLLIANPLPESVHAALLAARVDMIAVASYATMLPGSADQALAVIDVPVFLALGERDLATDPHSIPSQFPKAHDITMYVVRRAGHNHNVEPTRELLWRRLLAWIRSLDLSPRAGDSDARDT